MRHAQTVDNAARIWQGHKDSELSEHGRAQVEAAAPHLAAYEPALLISSDLQRAASTADAIARLTGLEVRLDARFREAHVGEWQGMRAEDVREQYPELMDALDRGEDIRRGVTGETRADITQRVGEAIRELLQELLPGETAVVVAHGVSGRIAASEVVGLDQQLSATLFRGLENCHWAELAETATRLSDRTGWRLAGWNLGPWRV